MRGQEGWRRSLALCALLAGLAALLVVVLARDDSHSYRFVFENAGQLVAGDLVRIGGTPAGEIESIELSDDGQAEVEVSVDDEFAPLHAGQHGDDPGGEPDRRRQPLRRRPPGAELPQRARRRRAC